MGSALNTTRQNALILVFLLFVQLLLMSGSSRRSDGATVLESRLMQVTAPVINLGHLVGRGVRGSMSGTAALLAAHARNALLTAELENLRGEIERLREASLENTRLRRLMSMREDLVPSSIGASVIMSSLSSQTRMIVVDRGTADGLRVDLPVVAWGGAVGRVVAVGPHHAKVRLLTDPDSGAAGIVQGSRAQGVVIGQPEGGLGMLYVPGFSDVSHGDRVVSSGLDGIFPRGFGIGTVISKTEKADGSLEIALRPEIDYRSLEEVLILLDATAGELLEAGIPEAP